MRNKALNDLVSKSCCNRGNLQLLVNGENLWSFNASKRRGLFYVVANKERNICKIGMTTNGRRIRSIQKKIGDLYFGERYPETEFQHVIVEVMCPICDPQSIAMDYEDRVKGFFAGRQVLRREWFPYLVYEEIESAVSEIFDDCDILKSLLSRESNCIVNTIKEMVGREKSDEMIANSVKSIFGDSYERAVILDNIPLIRQKTKEANSQ